MRLDDTISNIIFEAAQSVAEADLQSDAPPCSYRTILLGEGACFDSMGFVNLVVAIEDSLESKLQVRVNLSEELSGAYPDPDLILTAGDLASFLSVLLQKRGVSTE